MNNKFLAIAWLIALQNCSATQMTDWEKDVINYCKDKLDDAIVNRYIEHGVIKNYKPRKEKHEYDKVLAKLEDHPMSNGRNLNDFVLYRGERIKKHYHVQGYVCTILNNILAIGRVAFLNNRTIQRFILPKNLLGIDCMAFAKTNITDIYIPDSVVALAPYAFYNCQNLRFVSVSKKTLGVTDAFVGCPNVRFEYRD